MLDPRTSIILVAPGNLSGSVRAALAIAKGSSSAGTETDVPSQSVKATAPRPEGPARLLDAGRSLRTRGRAIDGKLTFTKH